jgi:glycosyltransferase involved in cell wall biosynthesis
MNITFIIPTKDRSDILNQTLSHLLNAVQGLQVEIIVINDSIITQVENPNPELIKVFQNKGKGVATARNYGAEIATSSLLWFIDDDIWISKEIVNRALHLNAIYPDAVFNFNWVYPDYLNEIVSKTPFGRFLVSIEFTTMKGWCKGQPWSDNELFTTDFVAGATLLIPLTVYKRINGYDASFPLAGFEDYDFSVRIKNSGAKAFIEPTFVAKHNEVNKTSLRGFLKRTYNNAITRRHAVDLGYKNQELKFSSSKKIVYAILLPFEPVILFVLELWPAISIFDKVYFKFCQALIGLNIYKGYNARQK